jgi:hypothetical protein
MAPMIQRGLGSTELAEVRPQPKPARAKTQKTPRRQDRDALALCDLGAFARDRIPWISISCVRAPRNLRAETRFRQVVVRIRAFDLAYPDAGIVPFVVSTVVQTKPIPGQDPEETPCGVTTNAGRAPKRSQSREASAMRWFVWTPASAGVTREEGPVVQTKPMAGVGRWSRQTKPIGAGWLYKQSQKAVVGSH